MSKRRLVDPDQLMELVDQLRVAVPQDVSEAEEILRKREDLLNQSLGEARRIRASAETEYRSRVDESELIKESEKQGQKIIDDAHEKAKRILEIAENDAQAHRGSADRYSQEALYKLEVEVAGLLTTVRNGIEELESRQGAFKDQA